MKTAFARHTWVEVRRDGGAPRSTPRTAKLFAVAQFVLLFNMTPKGLADLKGAPARIDAGIKALEAAGGKMVCFRATMGAYDYVAVAEGPSDEVAAVTAMALAAQGYVTTQTLRAFTPEEFAGLVSQLP